MGDFMAEVVKIVLTGGPCGGKTSALKYISEELKKLNIPTITIGEVASRLFSEGKTPENVGSYEFHRELFEIQLAEENEKTQIAKNMDCEKAVLLFDRGLLDSRAYVTEDEFAKYAGIHNLNEDVILSSYDAVFHLVTSADGAEEYYGKETNILRREESHEKDHQENYCNGGHVIVCSDTTSDTTGECSGSRWCCNSRKNNGKTAKDLRKIRDCY